MIKKSKALGFGSISLYLLILLCVGCAIQPDSALIPTAKYLAQNPIPLPNFVAGIDPAPGTVVTPSSEICVTLYTGAIFEKGDTAESLQKQMRTTTQFLINNQNLPPHVFVRYMIPAILGEIIDGVGTGWITFCFTPDLARGSHLVTVNTVSSSGKLYAYSWALEIK
ncbi:MAG: hypothetical protein ABI690_07685 [Chloroflexota bacterium]